MSSLGHRVRTLREQYGFSPADLADHAGLPEQRVTGIERDDPASTWELSRIADALAVGSRELAFGDLTNVGRTVARFRAPTGLDEATAHDMRLLARARQVGRTLAGLTEALGDATPAILRARRVIPLQGEDHPWREGYALGEAARAALDVPPGPIRSVQELLERRGAHVAIVRFDQIDLEAASLCEPGMAPVVLLNAAAKRVEHSYARRAILAHELCHLLHDGGERDLLSIVSRQDDHSAVERRAGGFAPSFIAPPAQVEPHTELLPDLVVDVGETWGLSFEGAVWHAKNLGLVSEEEATYLLRDRARRPTIEIRLERPLRRRDPRSVGIDVTPSALTEGLVAETVLRAYEAEHISLSRAVEILRMA